MKVEIIKKGTEIIKSCLGKCGSMHLNIYIKKPNQEVMDMLLAKDYFKIHFNSVAPDNDILIFHNSEDEYAHNGDISFTCFLSQVPKVLEQVRKHKKVRALIKEIKKKKGGNK